jgi:hypothetical protein
MTCIKEGEREKARKKERIVEHVREICIIPSKLPRSRVSRVVICLTEANVNKAYLEFLYESGNKLMKEPVFLSRLNKNLPIILLHTQKST